ncbi:MAG: four-carbon acid sugar kinase family protein [Deinococcota bacterium]
MSVKSTLNEAETVQDVRSLAHLPPIWPHDLLPDIRHLLAQSDAKLVVLDDDPTGTQTVYDTIVLTTWSVAVLARELQADAPGFYILTNSRSLNPSEAEQVTLEIIQNLQTASTQTGQAFEVVSRSDSTLRGHFPLETDTITNVLTQKPDGILLAPYFLEGGRVTVNDTHYILKDDQLIPAASSEFAQDATFGYRNSHLPSWVAEKTANRITPDQVCTLSLEIIRKGGPKAVKDVLMTVQNGQVCVVNALDLRDLEVVIVGQLLAEADGKRFLARTAASYVQVRLGLASRPLIDAAKLNADRHQAVGGLVVVGSYVPTTTTQLAMLLEHSDIIPVELDVPTLLTCEDPNTMLRQASQDVEQQLAAGNDVALFTSRDVVEGDDPERSLELSRRVSTSLIRIIGTLKTRPRFLIAKGGITSSDVATQALNVSRAVVMGQLLPGIPVWQLGDESRYPGLAYVVFPGNVGRSKSLLEAVDQFDT